VPVDGVKPGQSYLQVAPSEDAVKQAPTLEPGGDLSTDDESRIYGHYGMDYTPTSSGRRLVRR
jgi:hypothetical protein